MELSLMCLCGAGALSCDLYGEKDATGDGFIRAMVMMSFPRESKDTVEKVALELV